MAADEFVADALLPASAQLQKLAEIGAVGCMNGLRGELCEKRDGGLQW